MLDHSKTIASIKGIEAILKDIKAKQDRAESQIKEWMIDTMYSPAHKEKKVAEIKAEFEQYATVSAAKLGEHAAAILDAETVLLNTVIDVNDSELANTLSIINSVGKGMPIDQQRLIAQKFRGDYHAEKFLSAVYEKNGLAYNIEYTDFDKLTRELRNRIAVFTSDSEKAIMSYRGVEKALNKMLDAINSDYRVNLGMSEAAFMTAFHAAAGLEMTGF